jgi:hypothetical protein
MTKPRDCDSENNQANSNHSTAIVDILRGVVMADNVAHRDIGHRKIFPFGTNNAMVKVN